MKSCSRCACRTSTSRRPTRHSSSRDRTVSNGNTVAPEGSARSVDSDPPPSSYAAAAVGIPNDDGQPAARTGRVTDESIAFCNQVDDVDRPRLRGWLRCDAQAAGRRHEGERRSARAVLRGVRAVGRHVPPRVRREAPAHRAHRGAIRRRSHRVCVRRRTPRSRSRRRRSRLLHRSGTAGPVLHHGSAPPS